MRVDGHFSPEHEGHAVGGAALLEDALRVADALRVVVREEEHGHAIVALVGKQLALLLRLLAEEAVGDLEEHAGAVAGVSLEALAASVLEVDEDRERVVEGLVAADALEVRDCADAAGVVLVFAAVEASSAGLFLVLGHWFSSPCRAGGARARTRSAAVRGCSKRSLRVEDKRPENGDEVATPR